MKHVTRKKPKYLQMPLLTLYFLCLQIIVICVFNSLLVWIFKLAQGRKNNPPEGYKGVIIRVTKSEKVIISSQRHFLNRQCLLQAMCICILRMCIILNRIKGANSCKNILKITSIYRKCFYLENKLRYKVIDPNCTSLQI